MTADALTNISYEGTLEDICQDFSISKDTVSGRRIQKLYGSDTEWKDIKCNDECLEKSFEPMCRRKHTGNKAVF